MSAAATPRVAVIVAAWNHVNEVIACLNSVRQIDYANYEVLLVDNASEDATVSVIREQFPEVTVVENAEPLAFCRGTNLALAEAHARGAEHVLILQQDVQATPGVIRELLAVLQSDPRIAVAGAKNLFAPEPSFTWFCHGRLTYGPLLGSPVGKLVPDRPPEGVRDVDYVSISACMIRCAAVVDVGGFDEAFVIVHEDIEWCTRAHRAGWRVVYADSAVVLHNGGNARLEAGPLTLHESYLAGRNALLFARRYATPAQRARLVTLMLFGFLARASFHGLYHVLGGFYGQLPFVAGMIDGFKRRLRRDRIASRAGFRFWKRPADTAFNRFLRWIGA